MCLGCGSVSLREELQRRFEALNPGWRAQASGAAPDGDVFLEDEQVLHFRVPSCAGCSGTLQPQVTFFGANVSRDTVQLVHGRLAQSDALLAAGSSLQVSARHRSLQLSVWVDVESTDGVPPRCILDTASCWRPRRGRFPSLS